MLQPVFAESYRIAYEDAEGHAHEVQGALGGRGLMQAGDAAESPYGLLEVHAEAGDGLISLTAIALAPIRLTSCTVSLHRRFDPGERIVLNGYQSWTDTHELSPDSVMRGIERVPRQLVRRFALDGSGDYRFVDYDEQPGHLHGFTYATIRHEDDTQLIASLDESHGFTLISMNCDEASIEMQTECPIRMIASGEEVELGRYLVAQGTEDEVFDRWFSLMGVSARPSQPLIGYTSWYRHYDDIDEDKILSDLDAAAASLSGIEARGARRVFQIDDGFAKVGDWLFVDPDDFPRGLAPIAQRAAGLGFTPGLWLAPFVCERDSDIFRVRPEWLLRDEAGDPVTTGSHWSGGYALDTLNPEFRDYITTVIQMAVVVWGFRLLKLDFLYAACMIPHGGMNRGELMADGIRLLREAAGDDCLLLGCGVPLASAFGQFEYCRIGCDVGLDWDGPAPMRLLHRERVSTRNSMHNTLGREPLDNRAFRNDPDVFFLRDDIRLSRSQRMMLLEEDAANASMLLTSDDMSTWSVLDHEAYQAAIATMLERDKRMGARRGASDGGSAR